MFAAILKRALVLCLILNSVQLGFAQAASAAPIGTQTLLEFEQRAARVDRIQSFLAEEHVRAKLIELGVSAEEVQSRIAALTDQELQMLNQHIDIQPAGGNVLVVVGIVFVVLLILELVGVTNVFTKL